ncbi:T9SS type A sorting domain-containing protein [Pinibacter soli]|uniref:T9SS type A sorting domain-containing protein n=1 Tax=Pinibacter soli TaxID=3044211 RepID=A0ABT6RE20_9BACT|nr:T9SS type A sorting domain-containing protein [Pinibacter soli]MDI3320823.1 T9SS type A sorting domain-containing protein [Pinibacter soli]
MRKLYFLLLCLSFFTLHSSSLLAANITWTGATGGSWNVASNWSTASVPGSGDNVTFNTSVTVVMNGLLINIASLNVTSNSTVVFTSNAITDINVSASTNALAVGSGSSLKIFTSGDNELHVSLVSGASGVINGTFIMEADTDPVANFGSTLSVNSGATLAVNGTVTVNPHGLFLETTGTNVSFNAGSNYIHARDRGLIPQATWDVASTIQVTGSINDLPTFPGTNLSLGNLYINCPNILNAFPYSYNLHLYDNTTIKGDLQVLGFNSLTVILLANSGSPTNLVTVNKNFVLSTNATVQLSSTENDGTKDADYTLQVNGNYVQSTGTFSLQENDNVTGTSKLGIKGNFNQTGGQFTSSSIATSSSKNLFVVELNGNAAQTITSSSGVIDNANNQVALRLNNTSGGVSLNNALQVGRLDLTSGVLTTTVARTITVRSTEYAQGVTSANNSSYVSGPVTRSTNTTNVYRFPTGSNGFYRPIEVAPNSTTISSYTANYFRTANGSPVAAPLQGISSAEYWSIGRAFGSDASVQLLLFGQAVPGAPANSALVVASNSGSQWTSAQGGTGISISPGNSVNGTATSAVLSGFNLFTFGLIGAPLPVILLDFTATKSGSSANLKWTVDEVDIPQSVEVLKSNNGRDFTKVGSVPGREGVTNYNYADALSDGNNYYRLRLIDKDGSVTYSKVAAILNQANGFAITGFAPTLVTRSVKLSVNSGSGGTMDLYITDMSGKVWRKFGVQVSTGNNEQQLDLSDLSAGVYQVFGYMNGERTGLIRFLKQ